jgi:hypothetical protein
MFGEPGTDSTTPLLVAGVSDAAAISSGGGHGCALHARLGTVKCWGANAFGQLGNGSTGDSSAAVTVSGISGASTISAGDIHTCAALSSSVKCWGYNGSGELGNGTFTSSPPYGSSTPVTATGVTRAIQISAGGHTCATLAANGAIKCWGPAGFGELGNGSTGSSPTAVTVSGVTSASSVTAYGYHSCAVAAGVLKCWGANYKGQLGDGTLLDSSTPVIVGAPGAPAIGSAVAGNTEATVSWTAPASNGDSPITGYEVTPYVGYIEHPSTTFNSTATTQTVTGLTNGKTYRFRVRAINSAGTGRYSTVTNPVTPSP